MMLQLPKVRRDGKFMMTLIDASEVKGIEPKTFAYNGSMFNGSKVFANGGSFYVLANPMLVAQAKCQALATGELMVIEAPKVQVIQGGMKSAGQIGAGKKEYVIPQYSGAHYKALKGQK